MTQKLANKTALVTGGSRGIGAAIAKRLAADGAKVAITYVSAKDKAEAVVAEIIKAGGKAVAIHADSADKKAVINAVKETVKVFGTVDILVNNAGVFVADNSDEAQLDRQFAINVHGPAAAVNAVTDIMGKGGRIISIGSVLGDNTPFPGVAGYSATKAALQGYTRGWARDLGPKGITVNLVQPGPIATDMSPDDGGDFSVMLKGLTPLARYGKPEEVAAAVAFLATPDAAYITGSNLTVGGGISI